MSKNNWIDDRIQAKIVLWKTKFQWKIGIIWAKKRLIDFKRSAECERNRAKNLFYWQNLSEKYLDLRYKFSEKILCAEIEWKLWWLFVCLTALGCRVHFIGKIGEKNNCLILRKIFDLQNLSEKLFEIMFSEKSWNLSENRWMEVGKIVELFLKNWF